MFICLIKYRQLIWSLAKRDVIGRYKGSVFGLAWSFFNPLVMLSVYTFVFSFIFNSRWSAGSESITEYALALFLGMIVHGLVAESLTKAPSLIVSNVNYVKKVVFPLEILPWVTICSAGFHSLVSLLVWSVFYIIVTGSYQVTALLLPVVLLPIILFSIGVSWFFSALGVYLRDVSQISTILATVLMFLSPVFYPVSNLSEKYQEWIYYNPLTPVIVNLRNVTMWGTMPDWRQLIIGMVIGLITAQFGFWFFQKTKRGFADVL